MMSPAQGPSPQGLVPERVKSVVVEGAKLLAVAATKVVTRAVGWGALGALLAVVAGVALLAVGALDYPAWAPWRYVAWALVALHPVAGAAALGYAGAMRGVGRAAIHVGVERGLVAHLVEGLLDRLTARLRSTQGVQGVAQRGAELLENLPLDRVEHALKASVDELVVSDELEGQTTGLTRRALRAVKRLLIGKIETYLLTVVRAERTTQGGGGVSMAKVRMQVVARAPDVVRGAIEGAMNQTLLVAGGLLCLGVAMTPIVLAVLRHVR